MKKYHQAVEHFETFAMAVLTFAFYEGVNWVLARHASGEWRIILSMFTLAYLCYVTHIYIEYALYLGAMRVRLPDGACTPAVLGKVIELST